MAAWVMALIAFLAANVLADLAQTSTHPNYRLMNAVFETVHDCDWLTCLLACEATPGCHSYNYRKPTTSEQTGFCELNDIGLPGKCEQPEKHLVYDRDFVFQQLRYEDFNGDSSNSKHQPSASSLQSASSVSSVNSTRRTTSFSKISATVTTFYSSEVTVASSIAMVSDEGFGWSDIPTQSQERTVLLGNELKLICTNAIQWRKDNSTSIPRASFFANQTELSIISVEEQDAGIYECTGANTSDSMFKISTEIYVQVYLGNSCLDVLENSSTTWGDGEYWIKAAAHHEPFLVYCDMTTAQGGWTLVHRTNEATSRDTSVQPIYSHDYRSISEFANGSVHINVQGLLKLYNVTLFTQMRWFCQNNDRIFHVMTAQNSTGDAVVNFFTQDPTTFPRACGSFVRLPDDNSHLASNCLEWGGKTWEGVGRNEWGRRNKTEGLHRIYKPVWTEEREVKLYLHHMKCDDGSGDVTGKRASLYVR